VYKLIKVIIVLPLFFITGCFSEETKTQEDKPETISTNNNNSDMNEIVLEKEIRLELIDYSTYMYGDMLTYHNSIISIYDVVLQAPDELFYGTVINKIIPSYSEILVELEGMSNEIENEEILVVHDVIVQAVRTQLDGFLLYKKAYEAGENLFVQQGNDKIREANSLFVSFDEKMKKLLLKYEVNHPKLSEQ
jgi:hypothetical protein